MKKIAFMMVVAGLLAACSGNSSQDEPATSRDITTVKKDASYAVLLESDVRYGDGLSHDDNSTIPFSTPLHLDIYTPDNGALNRPVYLFIHGGGFTGGSKTAEHIVEMATYFAARGWVFVSINYRTTQNLGALSADNPDEALTFYQGIAPEEWINFALDGAETESDFKQAIALYTAQRDAKAALRWIMANAERYSIDTNYVTVGGGSAGAITALALGVTDEDDFRDEISLVDDPTLATTNLNATTRVKSLVHFWGSNVKLELFEAVYGEYPYDSTDPELFMAHGTDDINPSTPFSEATELEAIFNANGIYNALIPLEGVGHGAWGATANGKTLAELSFDFLTERQGLIVE